MTQVLICRNFLQCNNAQKTDLIRPTTYTYSKGFSQNLIYIFPSCIVFSMYFRSLSNFWNFKRKSKIKKNTGIVLGRLWPRASGRGLAQPRYRSTTAEPTAPRMRAPARSPRPGPAPWRYRRLLAGGFGAAWLTVKDRWGVGYLSGKEEWSGTHRRGREERWRGGVWSAAGCSSGRWWPPSGPATAQRKGDGEECSNRWRGAWEGGAHCVKGEKRLLRLRLRWGRGFSSEVAWTASHRREGSRERCGS
jgi:hypothetical protein